jgi:dolichyl-phosphate beta-glucosyltransferase
MPPKPFLSIIIPAYNEEHRIPATFDQLFKFLASQNYASEVLLVENGSQDRTLQIGQEYALKHDRLRVLQSPQRGKGLAVQYGMLQAEGEYRFMCDADFSMPVEEINRFLPPRSSCHITIASREAPGAQRINEPHYRHFVGRGFNMLIRLLALPDLQDTQCGFKCFRGELAEKLFQKQSLHGWAFDVEILFIARRMGCCIQEIPIKWYFNPDSKVRVLRDSIRMGLDLLKIRINGWRGVYDSQV